MCSSYNPTKNVNTEKSANGEFTYTKSGYNGLECSCTAEGKLDKCEHSCMIGEINYV